jgi:scyllo-inositol 2-dehydrogenase (NADP+)
VSIRTAVIGFGTGGAVFHAPFLAADDEFRLDLVVTADAGRAGAAARSYPGARVVASVDDVLAAAGDLDLAVITTPPATHADLAHRCLDAGLAVVVDKPLAVTAAEGEALVEHAERAGRPLTVFQNRRWDGDFLTLRALISEGALGQVRRFESRFEWWKPEESKAWKAGSTPAQGGGMLYDLGTHLIDQAVQLFGPVDEVHAELTRYRPAGGADDDAFVSLLHRSGVRSHLWMNGLAAQVGPRFSVLGSTAAFTKWGLDPQEAALKGGARPGDPGFGVDPERSWGCLGVDGDVRRVPIGPGEYAAFYRALAGALTRGGPLPVDPRDAVDVLSLIERIHREFPVRTPFAAS